MREYFEDFTWGRGANIVAVLILFVMVTLTGSNASDVADDLIVLNDAVNALSADVASIPEPPEPVEFDEAALRADFVEFVADSVAEQAVDEEEIVAAVLDALLGPVPDDAGPTLTPTPTPEPTEEAGGGEEVGIADWQMWVIVTRDPRANLWFISGYNNADNPIMQIQEPRVQFDLDTAILVSKTLVRADGGLDYYEAVGPARAQGLFVRADQVTTDLNVVTCDVGWWTWDPAYPTVCILPPPPILTCADVGYTDFTVLAPDPHGFDDDGDGFGCETE